MMYSNTIINKPIPLNELKEELNYTNTETMHNNFVSFINYFINWFYTNTDFKKEPNKIGRPKYPDDNLLKVVILGFSEGITSGRKIEVSLIFDDRYKMLMNNQRPCYHCINDFKRNSHELIQAAFVYCVKFADYFQFIDLSIIAIDGSKIRANASRYKILKMEDIHFLQYMFKKEEIQNYINKIEKAPTKTRKEELINEAEKYLIEYKKEMNKNKSKQDQKTRKGCINFFTNSIKSITTYTNALMEFEKHNLNALIPNRTQSMKAKPKNKENKKYGKINFKYNQEKDTYMPKQQNTTIPKTIHHKQHNTKNILHKTM